MRALAGICTVVMLVALAACGATVDGDAPGDAAAGEDAGDAGDAPGPDAAVPLGPWGQPVPVPGITPVGDDDPTATGDLLELYFNRAQDIFVATRATTAAPFAAPVLVTELSVTDVNDTTPEVSPDGLTIYLSSTRPGGLGGRDIWRSTRATRASTWSAPIHVAELSSPEMDGSPTTPDELVMVLESQRDGTTDVYLATRASAAQPWGTPQPVAAVNTLEFSDGNPMLSADGLELYFDSPRSGDSELYLATRASTQDAFGPPQPIAELASPGTTENDMWISPDRRTLLFTSDRDGTSRLWQATR